MKNKKSSQEKFTNCKILSYKPTKSEEAIQQEIFMHIQNNYCTKMDSPQCVIFAVPNQNQQRLTNIGVVAGVSDMIMILPNMMLFLEIKTASGTQSVKQKEFEQKVTKLGHQYFILRSMEDFFNKVEPIINKNVYICR
jgi:hypothetical protein